MRRVAPARQDQEGGEPHAQRLLGGVHGGDDLVLGELLARQAGEVGPLLRNSISGALPSNPTQRTRSWIMYR